MQIKNRLKLLVGLSCCFAVVASHAAKPLWTFIPTTPTTISVPANGAMTVQYRVVNQSRKTHTLSMVGIPGITQITQGHDVCANPFELSSGSSCLLTLQVNGDQIIRFIDGGPVVCQVGPPFQCYRPSQKNELHIKKVPPVVPQLSVIGSPLVLIANGATGQLMVMNNSTNIVAENITSDFTGTALDGNVTETGNTCGLVHPGQTCTLTYTPGNNAVAQTSFTIRGTNTNVVMANMQIDMLSLTSINPTSGPAAGGTGFTLTGTGLLGVTSITFDGVPATSLNVVNSTTVTGVTPPHALGVVDVVADTPSDGSATLTNGFEYLATAVGQLSSGGVIACLNPGNNLIVKPTDDALDWGSNTISVVNATNDTDGKTNTDEIVSALGLAPGAVYAARLCYEYEIDSQGNTPCLPENECYDDWFLPAGNNTTASGQLNCLHDNSAALNAAGAGFVLNFPYWSSTQNNTQTAWTQILNNTGLQSNQDKENATLFRCVRSFTP